MNKEKYADLRKLAFRTKCLQQNFPKHSKEIKSDVREEIAKEELEKGLLEYIKVRPLEW